MTFVWHSTQVGIFVYLLVYLLQSVCISHIDIQIGDANMRNRILVSYKIGNTLKVKTLARIYGWKFVKHYWQPQCCMTYVVWHDSSCILGNQKKKINGIFYVFFRSLKRYVFQCKYHRSKQFELWTLQRLLYVYMCYYR